jgi:SAM-dependent methyltransferase
VTRYVFDNASEQPTAQRFANLERLYDGGTIAALEKTGIAAGWRCLEVGAGSGSIATWLADRVGPAGQVLATDIDPRFLETLASEDRPNVEVRRHDIAADALPERAFDLIHARLVLLHVPTAPAVLARLVTALRPGGWLVVEDFDPTFIDRSFPVTDPAQAAVIHAAYAALGTLIEGRGAGPGWARRLYGHFLAVGLEGVAAEGHLSIRPGGSPGAQLDAANFVQVRDALIDGELLGIEVLDDNLQLLGDAGCLISSPMMFTAWGRRP